MKGNTKSIFAGGVACIAAIGGFLYWQPSGISSVNSAPVTVDPGKYKDGTYTADGSYSTPGGEESVHVTVILVGDVITDSQFVPGGHSGVSKNFMGRFAAGYKPLVVGKNIDAVQLQTVSGSSLTPKGFMAALANIKTQAKS